MRSGEIHYTFSFPGGISAKGSIERSSSFGRRGRVETFGYRMMDDRLILPFGMRLEPLAADLVDICAAIAMCDRRAPRNVDGLAGYTGAHVRRVFDISIPVRHPDHWSRNEMRDAMSSLANVLSNDEWNLRFEDRSRLRRTELQLPLDLCSDSKSASVILTSPGLDSLLGIARLLCKNEHAAIVPVSVITHYRARRVIDDVIQSLRMAFPAASLQGSQLHLFHRSAEDIDDRAGDYRTRILLCLAAGVAVAAKIGSGHLLLNENGPGAINLPTSVEQLERWTTRATHPSTLTAFAKLASIAFDREIQIENMGLWETKGRSALLLRDARFSDAASRTVSCERFPYVTAGSPCGTCMSCLYRQIALHRAGVEDVDLNRSQSQNGSIQRTPGRSGTIAQSALAMFVAQIELLLSTGDPYHSLDAEFLRIDEVLSIAPDLGMTDQEVREAILALYREFASEVSAYFDAKRAVFTLPRSRAIAS